MKKLPVFQVRISPELAVEIESMRESFSARITRPAFVEMLVRSGMVAHRTVNKLNELDSRSIAASAFKK